MLPQALRAFAHPDPQPLYALAMVVFAIIHLNGESVSEGARCTRAGGAGLSFPRQPDHVVQHPFTYTVRHGCTVASAGGQCPKTRKSCTGFKH